MKRIAWPIVIGLTLLVGCQNSEPKEETKQSTEQNQQKRKQTLLSPIQIYYLKVIKPIRF